ncbi:glycosyl transferase, family 2 protein-3 [Pasteurella testudinis]|nr:glycosyl transferase, family 2 protein-3 [Pasteurella testudinis]
MAVDPTIGGAIGADIGTANDAYQNEALTAAQLALSNFNYLSMVRLPLIAVDLPLRYAQHADLAHAWQILQMTVGGNTVFRRALFLAAGGFPQDPLFRRLGGEDGALGRAFVAATVVGTLFDQWGESGLNGQKCGNDSVQAAGVLHFCRDGMHAERLLDAVLFQRHDPQVLHYLPQAEQVTQRIIRQLQQLSPALQVEKCGVMPLYWQV